MEVKITSTKPDVVLGDIERSRTNSNVLNEYRYMTNSSLITLVEMEKHYLRTQGPYNRLYLESYMYVVACSESWGINPYESIDKAFWAW